MNSIGGYFGLEILNGKEYHTDAIRLNTGRNALEYILKSSQYQKIYIPFYSCDVLLQPIIKLGIAFEYYSIDGHLEPLFDFNKIRENEAFIYTNYFGLKDEFINSLKQKGIHIIIDNAQSFFSRPLVGMDTFYSPRKFFGISDGAYLYVNKPLIQTFEKETSYQRFSHLLRQIDENTEAGYPDFIENEHSLNNIPIFQMSNLTQSILKSINYDFVASKRRENFIFLHKFLKTTNLFQFELKDNMVPMVYPYYSDKSNLRLKLIQNRIYIAKYWLNVLDNVEPDTHEWKFVNNIIPLPIDQRYSIEDLNKILNIIIS